MKRKRKTSQQGNDNCAVCGLSCKHRPSTAQTKMIADARAIPGAAILKDRHGGRVHPHCDRDLYQYLFLRNNPPESYEGLFLDGIKPHMDSPYS